MTNFFFRNDNMANSMVECRTYADYAPITRMVYLY